MLFHLLYPLRNDIPGLNVTQYITFRTAAASLTALLISFAMGPWVIRRLREFQIGQVIRHDGPATHRPKAGTPTMGGLLILTASLVPTLLWSDLRIPYVWIAVVATAAFGAVGFMDDYLKVTRRSHHGLSAALQDARPDRDRDRCRPRRAGARVGRAAAVQHAPHLSVLQAVDTGSGLVLRSIRRGRARGREQRRQPDRRPGRTGNQRLRGRGGGVHRTGLRVDAPRLCRIPAPRAPASRGRGADDFLRRALRREPGLPLVQLAIRPRSSWATSARSRSAARSARSPS